MRVRRARWLSVAAAILLTGLCTPALGAAASSPPPATTAPPTAVSAPTQDGPGADAARTVEGMTTAEQAASVVMGHIPSTDAAALTAYMSQGLGGFILMGANIPATSAELETLTAALVVDPSLPPLIAVDQEGGLVSRLPVDDYASSRTLKGLPVAATSAAFSARGALVAQSGIDVDFGTIADVTADPSSFIYGRALGTDPQGAAERVSAATTAQESFVASTLKHFPGHGAAPGDSHHAIPTTDESLEQWRASDALPFIAGVDAGASLLMFGHLAYTAVDAAPASLSARWHEIARDELGFRGVIVTDDLGMLQSSGIPEYRDPVANAVAALAAGNDLVLMVAGSTPETAGQMVAGIVAAVESGTLSAERLADAATRVLALRLRLSATSADWTLCPTCEPVS
ncbi:glycoside hydrolase family 3 N-terminal domain-containing protein [Microbacterium sp. OVT16B]|uniref:glycoside hydrolase family 3 N-terminal domain-containing protein n=1 Tax=Microbacterium sp. OVT16B TaxID=2862682 RepID=UPI001CBDD4D5|nr:glycoside hydrolase family 3 N-terminal domain-containing protein [Microbacterium sp. OVT16B]